MTKKDFAVQMDASLKSVRKEYGFTQEKMAAVLGISKKTLVEIEKGRSSLGWTGAAAFAAIFSESIILQEAFGGELTDLVEALAFAEAEPQYPKTIGGKVWWREIMKKKGFRIQQNLISGHFRLLDKEDHRLMASFELERVLERMKRELQG
ncbi:MAG: helix-turn-helix domain-containing protein [Anaerotignum sp.]|nr:helix-turn-helix domain-containing protein [Anaerotignum sp.]